MGSIKEHPPVKLIIAVTYRSDIDIEQVISKLEQMESPVDNKSEVYEFSMFTSYYQLEMGEMLKKCFVTFKNLINPEKLPSIKVNTNNLEMQYECDKKRRINIDPGYITQAKLILATTKNYSHRIYIGDGIFGDVHMQYSNKSYRPQTWTYPDYKDDKNVAFFNNVRQIYLKQLTDINS